MSCRRTNCQGETNEGFDEDELWFTNNSAHVPNPTSSFDQKTQKTDFTKDRSVITVEEDCHCGLSKMSSKLNPNSNPFAGSACESTNSSTATKTDPTCENVNLSTATKMDSTCESVKFSTTTEMESTCESVTPSRNTEMDSTSESVNPSATTEIGSTCERVNSSTATKLCEFFRKRAKWSLVLLSFLQYAFVFGIVYSIGMFYESLRDFFNSSNAQISWLAAVFLSSTDAAGPLVGAAIHRFGCMRPSVFGTLLASASIFVSTFSPNIATLIVTFGLLGGVGQCFIQVSAVVSIGHSFTRRRALATGMVCSGAGVGSLVFPIMLNYFLLSYGWKGSFRILSGIVLCVIGFAVGYRFVEAKLSKSDTHSTKSNIESDTERSAEEESEKSETNDDTVTDNDNDNDMKSCPDCGKSVGVEKRCKIIYETDLKKPTSCEHTENKGDIDMRYDSDDGERCKNCQNCQENERTGTYKITVKKCKHKCLAEGSSIVLSGCSHTEIPTFCEDANLVENVRLTKFTPTDPTPLSTQLSGERSGSQSVKCGDISYETHYLSAGDKEADVTVEKGNIKKLDGQTPSHNHSISISLEQKEFIHSVTEIDLKQRVPQSQFDSFTNTEENVTWTETSQSTYALQSAESTRESARTSLKFDLDLSVLKSPSFLLYIFSILLRTAGLYVPSTFIPPLVHRLRIDSTRGALLVSFMGVSNVISRVISGFISDQSWANLFVINGLALLVAGVGTSLVPILTSYPLLAAYSVVFGLCTGAFSTVRTPICIKLLGLQKLANSFGWVCFAQGLGSLIGTPLVGFLADTTGDYNLSFHITGGIVSLAGLLCFPLQRIKAWEENRVQGRIS